VSDGHDGSRIRRWIDCLERQRFFEKVTLSLRMEGLKQVFCNRLENKNLIHDWFLNISARCFMNGRLLQIRIGIIFIGYKLKSLHVIGP